MTGRACSLTLLVEGVDAENLDQLERIAEISPGSYVTSENSRTFLHVVESPDWTMPPETLAVFVEAVPGFRAVQAWRCDERRA